MAYGKVLYTKQHGERIVHVQYDPQLSEYRCRLRVYGVADKDADYFTNDKDDAIGTADAMATLRRLGKAAETVPKHSYIAVIGRLHGDDEASICFYENMTTAEASHAFTLELRRDAGVLEADVVACYEYTNVYINHVLTSTAPINKEN